MTNTRSTLEELRADLAAVMADWSPAAVHEPDVIGVWETFGRIERLAAAGRVSMAARVEATRRWKDDGAASAAEWMALGTGSSVGRSRAELGTSQRLEGLPETAAEFCAGNLSAEQADAITDAAVVNPDAEADLLAQAQRDSLRRLRDEAARRKAERDRDPEERQRRAHRNRKVRTWTDREGSWHLHANGTVLAGAEITQALDRLIAEHYQGPSTPNDQRESREAYAFDALVDLARHATDSHAPAPAPAGHHPAAAGTPGPGHSAGPSGGARPEPTGSGSPGSAGPAAAAATRKTERLKRLMIIRVDLAALVRGTVSDGEICEIAGIGPIPVTHARTLMGDSILKAVLTRGVAVRNVTHLGRGPTIAQQIAMLWHQPTCQVQGCNRTVGLQYDHTIDWTRTLHTRLDELQHLCTHHHQRKTSGHTLTTIPTPNLWDDTG